MSEKSRYATKKKGKTEVDPFQSYEDIKGMMDYFKDNNKWDHYLTFMFGLLLGRRIGDTISMKWSDIYYENGKMKDRIETIEEQKTGKTTTLFVSEAMKKSIEKYLFMVNIDPIVNLNNFVFMVPCKQAWVNRKDDDIYKINVSDLEEWLETYCLLYKRNYGKKRKEKIISDFRSQKKYETFGQYLYYEVEYSDVVKWQEDEYRKEFRKAARSLGIDYPVGTHSTRKTFGFISEQIHPWDINSIQVLMKIFNHSSEQQTKDYIGITKRKMKQYFDDMGETVERIEAGDLDVMIDNSPLISLRHEDLRLILSECCKGDIELYNKALNMVDEKKIKIW